MQVQEENKETPQSKVVIHQVEDLNSIRDKYPYEIFIKDKLPNVDKQSQKKYSKALKLSKNIAPLAFFLFKNTELNASTMKSYAATCKEYYKEYKEFDLEMLKSLYIQKDFMKSESKETLKKKWKQWRRICHVSFGISKSNFPKIQFTSTAKTNKHVQLNLDKDDIENSWKTLAKNGKTEDALLVHIIYELGLRTGEVWLLRFEDIINQEIPYISILDTKINKTKQLQISQELFDEITNYEKELKTKNEYEIKERLTPLNEKVSGHFIFNLTRRTISRKFKSNFDGIVKNFDLRPKDLKETSIKNRKTNWIYVQSKAKESKNKFQISNENRSMSDEELNQGKKTRRSKKKK